MIVESSLDMLGHVWGHVDRLVDDVQRDARDVARESEVLYSSLMDQSRNVKDAWRAAPRFARILKEGAHIAAAYRVHQSRSLHLSAEKADEALEALHRRSAERAYELCVELRGAVLKLGQFVSCRLDLLPAAWVEPLSRLQDRVPPVGTDLIIDTIEEALDTPLEELYKTFNPEALAAASLAQVHEATLQDGTDVVVKVQIPGIRALVETDLRALKLLADWFSDLLPPTDIDTVVTELSRSVLEELDYEVEARNLADFAAACANDDAVVVPDVYPSHSAGVVLTLGRIEGQRLVSFLDKCSPAERDAVFGAWLNSICAQVLDHGVMHADPHPGNFLVCKGPRLAVLDFGSVQRFTPQQSRAYARIVMAVMTGDRDDMATQLSAMGFQSANGSTDGLLEMADMLLEAIRQGKTLDAVDLDPMAQLQHAIELLKENPVVAIPETFVQLGRVLAAVGGLVMHYKPRINLLGVIGPYLAKSSENPDP